MIPLTTIHDPMIRVLGQISHNLTGLQADIRRNALQHKAWAETEAVPIEKLSVFVSDCAEQYLRRLAWVTDYMADPDKKSALVEVFAKGTEQEIESVLAPLFTSADSLKKAAKGSYSDIIAACDQVIGEVNDVPREAKTQSLWPE